MDTAGGGGGGRAAAGGVDGGLVSDERPGGIRLDFASNGQPAGGAEGEASFDHEIPLFLLLGKSDDEMLQSGCRLTTAEGTQQQRAASILGRAHEADPTDFS